MKIIAKFFVNEENTDDFLDIAEKLTIKTREEKGNISYELIQDTMDKTCFIFLESWDNLESIKSHNESRHFQMYLPQITELCYKKAEISFFNEIFTVVKAGGSRPKTEDVEEIDEDEDETKIGNEEEIEENETDENENEIDEDDEDEE